MSHLLKLGVNIDHVATLRQARGTTYPDPLIAARLCAEAGADGLTVHLREDRRHIQDHDVRALAKTRPLPLNLEMAAVREIADIAMDLKPDEVCLVPERRREVTTEGGLNVADDFERIRAFVVDLQSAGIIVSLFIDADERQIDAAAATGAEFIELHTGAYCDAPQAAMPDELAKLIAGAGQAHAKGLRVNAGHGIHLDTITAILEIPHLEVLNIGHSIIARAVFVGLKEAIGEMKTAMQAYCGGRTS